LLPRPTGTAETQFLGKSVGSKEKTASGMPSILASILIQPFVSILIQPKDRMPTVAVGDRQVCYQLKRSARAKYVRLKITPDGVLHVTVPMQHQVVSMQQLLAPQSRWIVKHLRLLEASTDQHAGLLVTGSILPFLGRDRRLEILTPAVPEPLISLIDDTLYLAGPSSEQIDLHLMLHTWYRERAAEMLHERVEKWSRTMRLQPRRLTVRDQRTRWGSCSTQGNLNFNWRLVMAPLPVVDYLVVHELMHLREMNHSDRFWAGVARHCPRYEEQRLWLKDNGRRLSQVLARD